MIWRHAQSFYCICITLCGDTVLLGTSLYCPMRNVFKCPLNSTLIQHAFMERGKPTSRKSYCVQLNLNLKNEKSLSWAIIVRSNKNSFGFYIFIPVFQMLVIKWLKASETIKKVFLFLLAFSYQNHYFFHFPQQMFATKLPFYKRKK